MILSKILKESESLKGLRVQKNIKIIIGSASTHTKHDFFKAKMAMFFEDIQKYRGNVTTFKEIYWVLTSSLIKGYIVIFKERGVATVRRTIFVAPCSNDFSLLLIFLV